jgi:hypothetical protein
MVVPAAFTLNVVAARLLNDTAVVPWKFTPLMAMEVPGRALAGAKGEELKRGGKENTSVEQPVAPGVVTQTVPVFAPAAVTAVICVSLSTVNAEATPPNFTSVAPVKRRPVITTDTPGLPRVGVKELT